MHRWRLPATLAIIAAVAVTGCASSSKSAAKPAVTTSTTVPLHPGNDPALRHNVIVTTCVAAPGGWQASGTAANSTKSSTSYKITIFFANSQGTIEGTGQTRVSVGASKTARWSTTAAFASADPKTTCVLSGVA